MESLKVKRVIGTLPQKGSEIAAQRKKGKGFQRPLGNPGKGPYPPVGQ